MAFCNVEYSKNSGIRIQHSAPNIHNCKISNNSSDSVGARISVLSPTNVFRIENCLISKNNVLNTGGINERGGGISSSAESTYIISSIIYSNTVTGENHSEGGGLFIGTAFSAGTVPYASIEGCIVRKNSVSAHCQISSYNGQAFGGGALI